MTWPLGEIKALATKAARGAGFSWSLAEEAGYATQWLEAHGVAGVAQLANYLQWVEVNGLPVAPIDMLGDMPESQLLKCPIALGCLVSDADTVLVETGLRVQQPALLLPFLGLAAGERTIVCNVNEVAVAVCATGVDQSALALPELSLCEAIVSWHCVQSAELACVNRRRVTSDTASMSTLRQLAQKTYAPATEASRLAGAGAGTTDND